MSLSGLGALFLLIAVPALIVAALFAIVHGMFWWTHFCGEKTGYSTPGLLASLAPPFLCLIAFVLVFPYC